MGKIEHGASIEILIDAKSAEIISQLFTEIQKVLNKTYDEGKRDGSSLLMRLANGEITFKEFDRQVVG